LATLEEVVSKNLETSTVSQRIIEVIVKEGVQTVELDQIIEKLYSIAKGNNKNTLMILTGSEGSQQGERILSFQQTQSKPVVGAAGDNTGLRINKFLTPNVLTGLMVAIFLFSILLFGFLLLFDV
jgi:hypothetical protein